MAIYNRLTVRLYDAILRELTKQLSMMRSVSKDVEKLSNSSFVPDVEGYEIWDFTRYDIVKHIISEAAVDNH